MASSGKDKNASQFFITTGGSPDYLDDKYTVFGEIAEGLDVLEQINSTYCDDDGRPYFDIRIRHTYILDDPFPDPPELDIPPESPLVSLIRSSRYNDCILYPN